MATKSTQFDTLSHKHRTHVTFQRNLEKLREYGHQRTSTDDRGEENENTQKTNRNETDGTIEESPRRIRRRTLSLSW